MKSKKELRKELIKNYKPTQEQTEKANKEWEDQVIKKNEYYDLDLGSKYNSAASDESGSHLTEDNFDFNYFIKKASSPTAGKFAEFLFKKIFDSQGFDCIPEHGNGIDFVVEDLGNVDVKLVRHLNHKKRPRFRRYPLAKQLPEVNYAYIIVWSDAAELRVEFKDNPLSFYDCLIPSEFIQRTWMTFDKSEIKYPDKSHSLFIKKIKKDLSKWIRDEFSIKARVIQRGDRARNELMRARKWGADNFYEKDPIKHDMVVLLLVDKSEVYEVWAYPTSRKKEISWQEKHVGTRAIPIIGFDPNQIDEKFKFEGLDNFKSNFKERFNSIL